MFSFQRRARQVPIGLRLLIIAPGIALGLYWSFTYSGLMRLLAEWQLTQLGSYSPRNTGAVVVIVCLIPAIIVIQIIGRLREAERSPAENAAVVAREAQRSDRNTRWLQSHRWRFIGLVGTATLLVIGAYSTARGLLAGKRVDVDAWRIETGQAPGGSWVEISGRLVAADAVSVSKGRDSSSTTMVYVPVVSGLWKPGRPVRVYLETYDTWLERYADDLAKGRYEGMLTANALPGVALTALAERGRPAPDQYWVLDYRETPAAKLDMGVGLLEVAGVLALLTALGWVIAARRERRAVRRAA